jgi:transcriptional regulator with GAF, ATPase, and Fis domain
MIGVSASSRVLTAEIERAARSDAKVLITGPTGVGKEIAARLIHRLSERAHRRIVTINCAGITDSVLESELFGHVRGSFTDAYRDRVGQLELGNRGIVFLDEVGEMSPRMQAMLLRFLETGEIQRVGGAGALRRVDVRVIAATNRDLAARVASADLREDLYYRLNVISISIPPLCQRSEDVPLLLRHFFARYARAHFCEPPEVSAEAFARLVAHDWPGNVREVKNVVERLSVLAGAQSAPITVADLPAEIRWPTRSEPVSRTPSPSSPAQVVFDRMVKGREKFWSAVYAPFMTRDLTRSDVREVVAKGLERAGTYKNLAELFNLSPLEYRRFLDFVRMHGCDMRFQSSGTLSRRYSSTNTAFSAGAADRRRAREP